MSAEIVPAGAPPERLDFAEMYRRAVVLAKTELVHKTLQGKPEAIMVVGIYGAEHGVPLMTSITDVHIIENRPSPSAQLRLAFIRRAGHEVRFVDEECDDDRAVIVGRRREYRGDETKWTRVTYTRENARTAHLLDRWVWPQGKSKWVVGNDLGDDLTGAPEWVGKALAEGGERRKDNWYNYPGDMLRARAASKLARMEFSDVMLLAGADPYTAEEQGIDLGQDLDEPVAEAEEAVVVNPAEPPDDGPFEEPDAAELARRELVLRLKRVIRSRSPEERAGLYAWMASDGIDANVSAETYTLEQLKSIEAAVARCNWPDPPAG